jgi:uncharacterized radical SAM superfamily protein
MNFENMLEESRRISRERFGKKIHFYAPSFIHYKTSNFCSTPSAFPAISLTGSKCALNCKHCGGKILNTMIPATTPKALLEVCKKLKEEGAIGCLISGGCIPNGSVPVSKFIPTIAQIKKELNLTLVIHTGLIGYETAKALKHSGVDTALIDVIGSDETISDIYGSTATVKDYDKSLSALEKSGLHFIPHIVVGLHYGKLRGELQALEIISKHNPLGVIIVAFMPIEGTAMEEVKPPSPKDITQIIITTRLKLPRTPIVLGCARPRGEHRITTDTLAIKAGVNAIAFPAPQAVEYSKSIGLEISFSPQCCSQIYSDLHQPRTQ